MTPPTRSRWLRQGAALAASFATAGLVVAAPPPEQAGSAPQPTNEELLRRLEQRDAVIVDLQRRVGELERQIATTADRAPAAAQSPVAAKPVPSKAVNFSVIDRNGRTGEAGAVVTSPVHI